VHHQPTYWRLPLLLALLCAASAAMAQAARAPADAELGASVSGILAFVEARNPELRAMSLEADAAQQRLRGAGALPDPVVQMELRDIPFSEPTLSPANAGSTRYSLRQMYPLGDKRELRRGIAEAEATVAGAKRNATLAETRMRAKVAYSQYWYAARAQGVTEGLRGVMSDLEQIARSRYGSGLTPQQDVIKAQTELTSLRTDLVMLGSERRQAAARLNGVLARPVDAPLAEPRELRPLPERALDFAALTRSAGERSPVLAVNTAQITAAERNAQLMRASRTPDLGVGAAVIQRGTRLTDYELMLEVNIPWQTDIIRANVNEAQAMSDAAAARRDATAVQLQSELGQNWAALDALREQGQIVRSTLLPQVQLTFDSALSSYQTGRVDFATLLDAQRQLRRTRLDLLKIELEQQMRLAEIERIVGEDL
jgi:cobalt-zinc-cadmium efflux system outer membrane protein